MLFWPFSCFHPRYTVWSIYGRKVTFEMKTLMIWCILYGCIFFSQIRSHSILVKRELRQRKYLMALSFSGHSQIISFPKFQYEIVSILSFIWFTQINIREVTNLVQIYVEQTKNQIKPNYRAFLYALQTYKRLELRSIAKRKKEKKNSYIYTYIKNKEWSCVQTINTHNQHQTKLLAVLLFKLNSHDFIFVFLSQMLSRFFFLFCFFTQRVFV